jgi:hypothetical protein
LAERMISGKPIEVARARITAAGQQALEQLTKP